MTKEQILVRQKAVAAAVGSMNAEGLAPPAETLAKLKSYADGEVTATQLRTNASKAHKK